MSSTSVLLRLCSTPPATHPATQLCVHTTKGKGMTLPKIVIDVTSDLLCPFCWIGKTAANRAMTAFQGSAEFRMTWHPFFLREPGSLPKDGLDKMAAYTQKFGAARAESMLLSDASPVKQHGSRLGLEFNYVPGCKIGDTLAAHRALWYVKEKHGCDTQNALMEVLFRMYFKECKNPGDLATVLGACTEVGLDAEVLRAFLATSEYEAEVVRHYHKMSANGVHGVPYFVITGPTGKTKTMEGAAAPDEFVRVFQSLI